MKNSIGIGAIAGAIAGVMGFISTNYFYPLLETMGYLTLPIGYIAVTEIVLGIVWGIIFGVFYGIFYDWLPGKGIIKGIYFGLFLWLIANARPAMLGASHNFTISWAIALILIGLLSKGIVYGFLIGYLYKPPK